MPNVLIYRTYNIGYFVALRYQRFIIFPITFISNIAIGGDGCSRTCDTCLGSTGIGSGFRVWKAPCVFGRILILKLKIISVAMLLKGRFLVKDHMILNQDASYFLQVGLGSYDPKLGCFLFNIFHMILNKDEYDRLGKNRQ